ncbi:MAG: OmpA family protein [Bacteroidetes bacterium]|nr:OmpA family protein [Bacteroidota bacterium]
MKNLFGIGALLLFISSAVTAQQKKGSFIFEFTVTDYQLANTSNGRTLQENLKNFGSFKTGDKSFGIGVGYVRSLTRHINWSGNLQTVLSNFPAGYIAGDSVGQAKISLLASLRSNLFLLKPTAKVNPFLTAGAGIEQLAGKTVPYVPLGAGFQFIFDGTAGVLLQAQWQQPLSKTVNNPAVLLSLGIMQIKAAEKARDKTSKDKITLPVIADKDHDGFPDTIDQCPDTAGTAKGCPDRDGDGVADTEDRCPSVKGDAANFGCPVAVVKDTIPTDTAGTNFIAYFEPNKFILRGDAYEVLKEVLQILKDNPSRRAFIKGYTERIGSMESRYKMSLDRANTCADYLASYGIDRKRLTVIGFGSEHPAADTDDPMLQWKNRRVEIVLY